MSKSKIKGSGILVVILSSIVFSIYVMSTYAESEHFSILMDKYDNNNKEYYEKYIEDIDTFYDKVNMKNSL